VVRAQLRPDELIALLIPGADPRTTDIERIRLWAEVGGQRLDPLELLSARTGLRRFAEPAARAA